MKKNILILSSIVATCAFSVAFALNRPVEKDYISANNVCPSCNSGYVPSYSGSKPGMSQGQTNSASTNYRSSRFSDENSQNKQESKQLRAESVEKIKGTVKNVNRVQYPDGPQVEITLETDNGDLKVLLGPAWYIDQNKVKVNSGDKILVIGYPVNANGDRVIMASEIQRNGASLKLRDDQRNPAWGSRRPGSMNYSTSYTPGMGR